MTIQERFELFHTNNPHVYRLLRRFALEAKARGRVCFGARQVYERARWFASFETDSDDQFKLNDNYISRYARKLMEDESELEGFFRTRRLRA